MSEPPLAQTFDCHRGIVPTLGVSAGLAVSELLVTHLLVSLVWPRAAWWISGATLLLIIWLVRLREPLPDRRRTSAIAVRLDDPAAFDRAMAAALARA